VQDWARASPSQPYLYAIYFFSVPTTTTHARNTVIYKVTNSKKKKNSNAQSVHPFRQPPRLLSFHIGINHVWPHRRTKTTTKRCQRVYSLNIYQYFPIYLLFCGRYLRVYARGGQLQQQQPEQPAERGRCPRVYARVIRRRARCASRPRAPYIARHLGRVALWSRRRILRVV
jgi:hypothetical protein